MPPLLLLLLAAAPEHAAAQSALLKFSCNDDDHDDDDDDDNDVEEKGEEDEDHEIYDATCTKTSLQQFQDVLGTQSMLLFLMNLFQPPLAFSSNQSHHFNRITPRWGGSGRGESVGGDGEWGRSPPSIIPHTTPTQPRHS